MRNGRQKKLPTKFYLRNGVIYYRQSEKKAISTKLRKATDGELYGWLINYNRRQEPRHRGKSNWSSAQFYDLFYSWQTTLRDRDEIAPSTVKNYERAARHLQRERWWRSAPLRTIGTDDALQYISKHRREGRFEPERDIRFLKQLQRWAIDHHEINARKIAVKTPVGTNRRNRVGRCITPIELSKLQVQAKLSKSRNAVVIFNLALLTGMRKNELMRVQSKWLDFKEHMIHIPAEFVKTRTGRSVPIPEPWIFELRRLSNGRRPDDGLFTDTEILPTKLYSQLTWWEGMKRRAGIKCRFHDLRVTCATRMAQEGITGERIEDILGHDREIRHIYTKQFDMKEKRSAMNTFVSKMSSTY